MLTWQRTGRFGNPEVFASIGLLSFLAARFLPVLGLPWRCPFLALTGLPCATCGMTHAFVHLAHGEVAAAVAASPLGALLAAGAWAYAMADLARAAVGGPLPVPAAGLVRAGVGLGVAAVLVNWGLLIVRALGA